MEPPDGERSLFKLQTAVLPTSATDLTRVLGTLVASGAKGIMVDWWLHEISKINFRQPFRNCICYTFYSIDLCEI